MIDSHSHMIWGGDRSREVRWKLQGKSYSEIANMGGGIGHTVQETKSLSEENLYLTWETTYRNSNKTWNHSHRNKIWLWPNTESEIKLLSVAKKLQHTPILLQ